MKREPRGIRTAREDFEVNDRKIRKGQILHIMIGAANRDPAQLPFCQCPRRDPQTNRHVSLGHGVHYCLGAALARLELRIAVKSFLARFPRYRLATEQDYFHGSDGEPSSSHSVERRESHGRPILLVSGPPRSGRHPKDR